MSSVTWITGISGAGKTTLSEAVFRLMPSNDGNWVRIDGDQIRAIFGADLSYKEDDRYLQISRIQRLAKFLSGQGINCLVSALYSHPELLRWNRDNLPNYFEVYIKAPLELVRQRDSKGLYRRAASGELSDVVGVDIPWHVPEHPDLVIDAADGAPPEVNALTILQQLGHDL